MNIQPDMVMPFTALVLLCFGSLMLFLKSNTLLGKIVAPFLLALCFSIAAYGFIPNPTYDLVRHHEMVERFTDVETVDDYLYIANSYDLEPLSQFYEFIISRTGDDNLLQSTIVFAGYFILFYMLKDYSVRSKLSTRKMMLLTPLVIFGQHILFYFSGLFNYFAINLFALGIYLDFVARKKRGAFMCYILAPFIHGSLLLPLALIMLQKIQKNKLTWKTLAFYIVFLVFFDAVFSLLVDVSGIKVLGELKATYDNYMLPNDHIVDLYDGVYLFMSITKLIVAGAACWVCRGLDKNRELRYLVYVLMSVVIVLSIKSIAMTRFTSLVLFAAMPIVVDAITENSKSRLSHVLLIFVGIVGCAYMLYSFYRMVPMIGFGA